MMPTERKARVDALRRNVPDELRGLPGWMTFRRVPKENRPSEFDKIPYYVRSGDVRRGEQGCAKDRAQLVQFDEALRAFEAGRHDGLGFAMLPNWQLTALDFDKCVTDGVILPAVAELVRGTYAEFSPSGRGVRAFMRGALEDDKSAATGDQPFGFETFHSSGFVTVTGDVIDWSRQ